MHLDGEGVFMQLASASSNYTKPELVMDTFLRWMDEEPLPFAYMIDVVRFMPTKVMKNI